MRIERSVLTAAMRIERLALRLTNDAQRLFVEAAERRGLVPIRQDLQEQPPRQMGGRGPAQVVAPLQAKPIHVEIDEASDHLVEPRDGVRSRRRRNQGLADAAQLLWLRHHAARRAWSLDWRRAFLGTDAEFPRASLESGAIAWSSTIGSALMR
jgi:hypothetical protein